MQPCFASDAAASTPRFHPQSATASGLIGALSIETAARYLNARDVDGVVIGEGLGPRVVDELLTLLAEDVGFATCRSACWTMPPWMTSGSPICSGSISIPWGWSSGSFHSCACRHSRAQLKRVLKSLETEGVIDPDTGLLNAAAFWRDLDRAVQATEDTGKRAVGRTLHLRGRFRSSRPTRRRPAVQPALAHR